MRESYSAEMIKGSDLLSFSASGRHWAAADQMGRLFENAHAVGLSGQYSGTAGLAARGGRYRRCRNGDRQRADSCY